MRVKRTGALFMAACLLAGCLTGCKSKGVPEEELVSDAAFEGAYLVTADYVKEHAGDENVLLVDCRGVDKAKKETLRGRSLPPGRKSGLAGRATARRETKAGGRSRSLRSFPKSLAGLA